MTDDLKPCPFCGSDNLHIICYSSGVEHRYQVECRNCEATTSREYSRTLVIERWNTRREPIGNSDELPGWLKEAIRLEIKKTLECKSLVNQELIPDVTISTAYDIKTSWLDWVLSLKKEE